MISTRVIHGFVFALWAGGALIASLWTAELGGEEARLIRERGTHRQAQLDLVQRQERLLLEIDRVASPVRIGQEIERLGLDVRPPRQVHGHESRERLALGASWVGSR